MTFTQIVKDIFTKKPKQAQDNSQKGGVKAFMSKLSGAFMLPISIMAVAGLFLGVGAAIDSHTQAKVFGLFIKNLGDPIFGAMPALFLVAIIIAFTDEAGVAVFAGIVGFLVFNALQIPFTETVTNADGKTGSATFLGINTNADIASKMYSVVGSNLGIKSLNTSIFGGIVVGFVVSFLFNRFHQVQLPQIISFFGGKRFVAIITILVMIPLAFLFLLIWPWIGLAFAYFGEYSGKVAGLDSFLFGFIERSLIPFGLHHAFYAPLWWTAAGGDVNSQFIEWAKTHEITAISGQDISLVSANQKLISDNIEALLKIKDPATDKFLFSPNQLEIILNNSGLTTEILTIGGTNEAPILKFAFPEGWKDDAVNAELARQINALSSNVSTKIKGLNSESLDIVGTLASIATALKPTEKLNDLFIQYITANGNYMGDSFGWLAVNGSGINNVTFKASTEETATTMKVFPFIADQLGIRFGRFMQGKFSFMQLGLPAAGAAMVMAAPKENRKEAFSIIFPAALTSFVTGVTEPIEFTFLFLAPALFWGFHALMAAFSFLFMNLLGAHVGMTFSGGIIDTIIYGALPFAQGTNFYWMYLIGVAYAPIYFFVFYWYIKRFNLETPGRGGNLKLFTKENYRNRKAANKKNAKDTLLPQASAIIQAVGGWDNITKFANCATRLRYDIVDKAKVDVLALKSAGAAGVTWVGTQHVQIIMGPVAEQLNSNIKTHIGDALTSTPTNIEKDIKKEMLQDLKEITIQSVAKGTASSLTDLKDEVFSKKMMGDGMVVKFPKTATSATVYAPISGELVTVFPTGHAYGIKTPEGVEILVHIGLDTVNLQGKGFKSLVKQGDQIIAGEKMAKVNLKIVRKEAPSSDVIVILTSNGHAVSNKAEGELSKDSKLFIVK